jgi:hypothetical protein
VGKRGKTRGTTGPRGRGANLALQTAKKGAKFGPKFGSAPPDGTPAGPPAPAAAIVDRTGERAVDLRAEILDRHRRAVTIARALSAAAVKTRDCERAKLAKITIETMKLVQEGERRAWGPAPPAPSPR